MKIDFIISRLIGGGAERVLVILANYFADQGHFIRIITLNPFEEVYELNPKIELIRLNGQKKSFVRIRNLLALGKFYWSKKNRPDLVISFLTFTNLVSIIICKVFSVPIIACEHNSHRQVNHPKWLQNFTWNYIYRFANLVTVLTKRDLDFFNNRGAKTIVMPNPSTFETNSNPIANRNKSIITVGSLDRYDVKGFDNLIPIVSDLLKENPDWDLKIIGSGTKGQEFIQAQIDSHNLSEQVKFLGFRKDVKSIYRENSILLLPSRREGFPMVLLEAMSQGMAVIAFDCFTGPAEIITDGVDGILVEDQNFDAMKKSLSLLIADESLRCTLGVNAMESIKKYAIEAIYSRWMEVIKTI